MIEQRFITVSMPLDKDGNGPADDKDRHSWQYEVWDGATLLSIAAFPTEAEANDLAALANRIALVFTYLRSIGE